MTNKKKNLKKKRRKKKRLNNFIIFLYTLYIFMTDNLDKILKELDRKVNLIVCIEHEYKYVDEVIRIHTFSKLYTFIYSKTYKTLRVYVDKDGKYNSDMFLGKFDYKVFDDIFMRYIGKMYELYKAVILIEDKRNKITKAYPVIILK